MDNPFLSPDKPQSTPFTTMIVAGIYEDGVSLKSYIGGAASQKHYKMLRSCTLAVGNKVLCARVNDAANVNGTLVVLGAIGTTPNITANQVLDRHNSESYLAFSYLDGYRVASYKDDWAWRTFLEAQN